MTARSTPMLRLAIQPGERPDENGVTCRQESVAMRKPTIQGATRRGSDNPGANEDHFRIFHDLDCMSWTLAGRPSRQSKNGLGRSSLTPPPRRDGARRSTSCPIAFLWVVLPGGFLCKTL